MSILTALLEKRDFTSAESELADYILAHADEVARMGLADLAFGAEISKIGISCVPADQYRFINEGAYHATRDDLALFVTYTGTLIDEYMRVHCEGGIFTHSAPGLLTVSRAALQQILAYKDCLARACRACPAPRARAGASW